MQIALRPILRARRTTVVPKPRPRAATPPVFENRFFKAQDPYRRLTRFIEGVFGTPRESLAIEWTPSYHEEVHLERAVERDRVERATVLDRFTHRFAAHITIGFEHSGQSVNFFVAGVER